ncbi:hypothetical protein Coch_0888 [Capnocytophaga ochracea DSM 7271]|uniref:Uncharacterized protein n=1 Tax=Capnocytophaga ochracea (strain ATCC 27872 / DSM 7271 / CCUG 9716 / JCM 12966 / NCTC 12371 / SS31 / VPI 2845) TaxID=521097 RepID=C7M997_CAPOD|nr:hypothetical protein Coch_0888 [Capnocytophaga ochracea DSM 7271]
MPITNVINGSQIKISPPLGVLPHSLKSNSAEIKANIRYSSTNIIIGAIIHNNTLLFLFFINQIV